MPPMYFEEYEIGQKFSTKRRTITETDIVNFAGISWDFNPLHTDELFAKETPFGRRIAHGMLVLSITTGLSQTLGIFEQRVIAFLGLEWNFTGPVFIGDTIHFDQTVADKRLTKNPGRGIVTFDGEVLNQDGQVVQKGWRKLMVLTRPA